MKLRIAVILFVFLEIQIFSICIAGSIAQFDINDYSNTTATEPGWVAVIGDDENVDSLTGSDGVYTCKLATNGDGQGRDRNVGIFGANSEFWRDFWFVSGSGSVSATVSGLSPNTHYIVQLWAYDKNSDGTRTTVWVDSVTGNSATINFSGSSTPTPASLSDSVVSIPVKTDGSGLLALTGTGSPTHIFLNGLSVSDGNPWVFEAESGIMGSDFTLGVTDGETSITCSTDSAGSSPNSAARVVSYSIVFSQADDYQLYARIYVGPTPGADDSFHLAKSLGVNSPTDSNDWSTLNSLGSGGYANSSDVVSVGGGMAGTEVWKWIKVPTVFPVSDGDLTQNFEIGGREDGLYFDKFVFAPAGATLTVAQLEAGDVIPEPPVLATFESRPGESVIHRFGEQYRGKNDSGMNPSSGLLLYNDLLVGTTLNGGSHGDGTVFGTDLSGAGFNTKQLFLDSSSGARPTGTLVLSGDTIYGSTLLGGTHGTGAIIKAENGGDFSILYDFDGLATDYPTNIGGASPAGALAISGSTLYGALSRGGSEGKGIIYSVSTDGSEFSILHDFSALDSLTGTNSDGATPLGGVIVLGNTIYGTTSSGGSGGAGIIFSMDTDGQNFQIIHDFESLDYETGANSEGAYPSSELVLHNDVLYGVTPAGGGGGNGAIFALTVDGSIFSALYHFSAIDLAQGSNHDGSTPCATLRLSGNLLFGVASAGGANGTGTLFSFDYSEDTFSTLFNFEKLEEETNNFGAFPVAPVLLVGHSLYGTTFSGGPGGTGTVFRIPIPVDTSVSITNSGSNYSMTLSLFGAPNYLYTVQATNDLSLPDPWVDLTNQSSNASGLLEFLETNLTATKRFYRAIYLP